jgi:hypothetical protein
MATNAARRVKPSTVAAAAQLADSPSPIAHAATTSEGATRTKIPTDCGLLSVAEVAPLVWVLGGAPAARHQRDGAVLGTAGVQHGPVAEGRCRRSGLRRGGLRRSWLRRGGL